MGFLLTDLFFSSVKTVIFRTPSKQDRTVEFFNQLALLDSGERDDRECALALEEGKPLPPPTPGQVEMGKISFAELLEKFLVADQRQAELEEDPGPSSGIRQTPMFQPNPRDLIRVECIICTDVLEKMACLHGPCGHFICTPCVHSMAEVASHDEGLLPLRCCQAYLPLNVFLGFLPEPLRSSFASKCAEAGTPPSLRIYCPNKRCSCFIGRTPGSTSSVISCPACNTAVCSGCKARAHRGSDCDENESREVRKLAQRKGWKNCPSCKAIVERRDGCNHMTCRCSQQFCYTCGSRWSVTHRC